MKYLAIPFATMVLATHSMSATWDIYNDFNANTQLAPWSYGYTGSLGGSFTADTDHTLNRFPGINEWSADLSGDGNPAVYQNPGNDVSLSTFLFLGHSILEHPGQNGEYSVSRWTAPTAGIFRVVGQFEGADPFGPTTSDVHILIDDINVYTQYIDSYHVPVTFDHNLALKAGETVDFAVGNGLDHTFNYDSTQVKGTISTVPEPVSAAALAIGFAGLIRKRKSQ